MKQATLRLLTGLVCFCGASMATADSGASAKARPLMRFDHGVPVFRLPDIVVTPAAPGHRPSQLSRRGSQRPIRADGKDGPENKGHNRRADRPRGAARYTAMQVVRR